MCMCIHTHTLTGTCMHILADTQGGNSAAACLRRLTDGQTGRPAGRQADKQTYIYLHASIT